MKWIAALALVFFSLSASASLITYSYSDPIGNRYETHEAVGIFSVDSQKRRLVSFDFVSQPVAFSWQGSVPLMYEQPVSNESKLFENGFKPVTWDKFDFFLFFDLFSLEAGQDIFHNIDRTHPYEGASVSGPAGDFWLQGRFNKVRTAKVPEPAAIGLLALGLVLFGFLRHRHRTGSAWF